MKLIEHWGKYAALPQVLIRQRRRQQAYLAWLEQEFKAGGLFRRLQDWSKATADKRMRAVARQTYGWKQNPKSDLRVLAHVPLHEWLRWRKQDPDFWKDNANLRSWRRKNEDAKVYL